MNHPIARALIPLWSLALVVMAWVISQHSFAPNTAAAWALRSEPVHVAAHTFLYGVLSMLLATLWFSRTAGDAPRRALVARALLAGSMFMLVASCQEGVQVLARAQHRHPSPEELYDLAVDVLAGAIGLILWSRWNRQHLTRVARTLGWILHPALVAPLGLFAIFWSALGGPRPALPWTALAVLSAAPAAGVWVLGVALGRFSDVDVSVRSERPPLFAAGLFSGLLYLALTRALGAPLPVQHLALAGLIGTSLLALVTVSGLKVSGHVSVAVALAVALAATSVRGPYLFAMAALLLSWARVREARHTPREVLGAWALAGVVAAVMFHRDMAADLWHLRAVLTEGARNAL